MKFISLLSAVLALASCTTTVKTVSSSELKNGRDRAFLAFYLSQNSVDQELQKIVLASPSDEFEVQARGEPTLNLQSGRVYIVELPPSLYHVTKISFAGRLFEMQSENESGPVINLKPGWMLLLGAPSILQEKQKVSVRFLGDANQASTVSGELKKLYPEIEVHIPN